MQINKQTQGVKTAQHGQNVPSFVLFISYDIFWFKSCIFSYFWSPRCQRRGPSDKIKLTQVEDEEPDQSSKLCRLRPGSDQPGHFDIFIRLINSKLSNSTWSYQSTSQAFQPCVAGQVMTTFAMGNMSCNQTLYSACTNPVYSSSQFSFSSGFPLAWLLPMLSGTRLQLYRSSIISCKRSSS